MKMHSVKLDQNLTTLIDGTQPFSVAIKRPLFERRLSEIANACATTQADAFQALFDIVVPWCIDGVVGDFDPKRPTLRSVDSTVQ